MKRELVIVGAGPAGLAAAIRAAAGGAAVTVIDEAPAPGGQIYRQPPVIFHHDPASPATPEALRGQALLQRFRAAEPPIELLAGTAVLGLFEERRLLLDGAGGTRELEAAALILATGAHERVVPFPGWTLPGVMTAGGCQILLKSPHVLPGRRVLVAGTGPLLLVVARQLARAGAQVVAVAEASSYRALWRAPHLLWGHGGLLREGWGYLRELRRAGVPFLPRHTLIAAHGPGAVAEAVLARVDRAWRPIPGTERTLPVDALAVGFGFVCNTELTRMADCAHHWAPAQGGWLPVLDPWQQTTQAGIFAAGDGAGVGGALVAEQEGALAALGALTRLDRLDATAAEAEARPLRRRLSQLARFRKAMDAISLPGPGLADLCAPDTVVCRCENVTRATLETAMEEGARSLDNLKRRTRAGMGFCQGRICMPFVAKLAARATGGSPERAGWNRPRPPLRPIPLAALAAATEGEPPES